MRRGASLTETLVVLAIVGLLLAIMLPAVQSARQSAVRVQCKNNLHQIGVAWASWAEINRENAGERPADPLRRSWQVRLLPYAEQVALSKAYDKSRPWDAPPNRALQGQMPPLYSCPNSAGRAAGLSSYDSPETIWLWNQVRFAFVDPTMSFRRPLALEVSDSYATPWVQPAVDPRIRKELESDRLAPIVGGNHRTLFHVLAAGGHVQSLSTAVDAVAFAAAFAEKAGAEVSDQDQ